MVFHILETAGSGKITSQNDHKNGFYTGWSKICIHLRQLEVPKLFNLAKMDKDAMKPWSCLRLTKVVKS